jgi:hypothetical protein
MDKTRFDHLAKTLATRMSRRGAVQAAGAASVGAAATAITGEDVAAQATRRVVTCEWKIDAEISTGPGTGNRYDGWLTLEIDRDGYIDYASLELDVPELPHPVYEGVGMANGRSVDFRLEGGECEVLAFTGVGTEELRSCEGLLEGSFQGPRLTDLGGWRTSLDEICEEGFVWDEGICDCAPDDCEPKDCPAGEAWSEKMCRCVCAPEPCVNGQIWSEKDCKCVPPDTCPGVDCKSWQVLDTYTCSCYCAAQACSPGSSWNYDTCSCMCDEQYCGFPYEWNFDSCQCGCPSTACENGGYRDPQSCECVCNQQWCPQGSWLDQETCQCICEYGTLCGGQQAYCTDVTADDLNCGACGIVCPAYHKCRAGVCVTG